MNNNLPINNNPRELSQARVNPSSTQNIRIGPSAQNYSSTSETDFIENFLSTLNRVIRNNLSLIFLTTLLVVLLSCLRTYLAPNVFNASSLLQVKTYTPAISGLSNEDLVVQQTREYDYLNTQIELISSLGVAEVALRDESLRNLLLQEWNESAESYQIESEKNQSVEGVGYKTPIGLLKSYLGHIKIVPVRSTSLVKIVAESSNPVLSAKIANGQADAFVKFVQEQHQTGAVKNLHFLQRQAEDLAKEVSLAEKRLADYAETNSIVSVNKDENIVAKGMADIKSSLSAAIDTRIKAESLWNNSKKSGSLADSQMNDLSSRDLLVELRKLESEYRKLSEKFTSSYPQMKELSAKISNLKGSLNSRKADQIKSIEAEYLAALTTEENLKKELESQKGQTFDLSKRQVKYNTLRREFDSLKDLHQSVLTQLKEAQLSAQMTSSNIAIAEEATIPQFRSSPRPFRDLIASLILGPFLGILLAFARSKLDRTVSGPSEVNRLVNLPMLAMVPDFSKTKTTNDESKKLGNDINKKVYPNKLSPKASGIYESSLLNRKDSKVEKLNTKDKGIGSKIIENIELSKSSLPEPVLKPEEDYSEFPLLDVKKDFLKNDAALMLNNSATSAISEVFRSLRTSILLSSASEPPKSIVFTSAISGEGKSVLASNTAISLSMSSPKPVLLINADLRRPSLHKYFAYSREVLGLSEYLTGNASLSEVINISQVENLHIIPAGAFPPNPAELLGSKKMKDFIQEMEGRYEHIIIDTPPVFPVTDAVLLSNFVSGVIIVSRAHVTPKGILKEVHQRLVQSGANLMGVVLNGVDLNKTDYYGTSYKNSYYYSYHNQEDIKSRKKATG